MPEKEPKFSEAEIDKKHQEALEMDKKAKEMVEKGEAKTPQEAMDKIEEKELEKSPEEMLKEALPLVWEEALKYLIAQRIEKYFQAIQEEYHKKTGRGIPLLNEAMKCLPQDVQDDLKREIKRRLDLAKKYNLEAEHFFYSPEKLERKIPTQEQIEKTAKEMTLVNEFLREFSKYSKKPVFCIFNARGGTIYSYGLDTLNAQLNFGFKETIQRQERNKISSKQPRTCQELRKLFAEDLRYHPSWLLNKNSVLLDVAENWLKRGRLTFFIGRTINTRVPSYYGKIYMDDKIRNIIWEHSNIVFLDVSERREGPHSFENMTKEVGGGASVVSLYEYCQTLPTHGLPLKLVDRIKREQNHSSRIYFDPYIDKGKDLWWDNFPQLLGRTGKQMGHGQEDLPTERIVQSAKQVEYLSEKVKNALRYYQKDEEGRNWFERNFEGIMLGKEDAPEKDTKEYLEKFRKWVPYETDEKGEAVLDDKGYPVPCKTAPMTVAAEDELARLEAAMEELSGQTFN